MLNQWLEYFKRSPNPFNFNVIDIKEKDNRDLEKVDNIFHKIFLENTVNIDLIKEMSIKIGWNTTFTKFIVPKLPKKDKMKKGKFGEILEGEILEKFFDFIIPVKKWKYAITSDQSLPSIDIVALKNNGFEITEMSLVECKVTGGTDKKLVSKAYQQLMDDLDKKLSPMIIYIIDRMYENNHPLYEMFVDYCLKRNQTNNSYRISAVFDKQNWDDESLENLNDLVQKSTPKLTVDIITIESLEKVMEEIYKKNGWSIIE